MAPEFFANNPNIVMLEDHVKKCVDYYWAENGIIKHENSLMGYYQSMSVRSFLHRLQGISEMLGNTTNYKDGSIVGGDENIKLRRFIDKATELARIAQRQGMPEVMSFGGIRRQRFEAMVSPSSQGGFNWSW